jgi:hypothetical protein
MAVRRPSPTASPSPLRAGALEEMDWPPETLRILAMPPTLLRLPDLR